MSSDEEARGLYEVDPLYSLVNYPLDVVMGAGRPPDTDPGGPAGLRWTADNGILRIRYDLPAPGPAALRLFNARGALVARRAVPKSSTGTGTVGWDLSRLSPGIYRVRVVAGGQRMADGSCVVLR